MKIYPWHNLASYLVEKMTYPSQELGSLFHISVIVGSEEKVATLHSRFNAFVLGETTTTTWTELEWFADELYEIPTPL